MVPLYQQQLAALRQAFPAPVSDPVHDGYVVFSLLRALDRVDALKTQAPILGTPRDPDYASATLAELPAEPQALESVIPQLVHVLDGMLITAHPRSQVNVVAPPSIASVIGVVLPSMYNPNLCSDESGRGFSEAEVRVASIAARLIGYDPTKAGGAFTFGGTGTLLYGLKIGLEKALPGTLAKGVRGQGSGFSKEQDTGDRRPGTEPRDCRPVVLCSEQGHYACTTVAGWLGIGQNNVIRARSQRDNSVDVAALEAAACEQLAAGRPIAAIVA